MIDLEEFRSTARAWLEENRAAAPRDYGAILPPDLVDQGSRGSSGCSRKVGLASTGPRSTAGEGSTPDHNATWIEECARLGVPAFINMVGLVLAGTVIQKFGTDEQKSAHLRDARRRTGVVPAVLRTRRGQRPGGLTTRAERDGDGGSSTDRRSGRAGPLQRLGHPDGPHGPRRAEAQGHLVLPVGHAPPGSRSDRCAR